MCFWRSDYEPFLNCSCGWSKAAEVPNWREADVFLALLLSPEESYPHRNRVKTLRLPGMGKSRTLCDMANTIGEKPSPPDCPDGWGPTYCEENCDHSPPPGRIFIIYVPANSQTVRQDENGYTSCEDEDFTAYVRLRCTCGWVSRELREEERHDFLRAGWHHFTWACSRR